MALSIVPFGPQHPVLPEPLHIKVTLEDETITDAMPTLGYVHRGLESLAAIRDIHQMVQVVERVCGICSMIHAMCYCHGLEEIMKIEVPPRAKFLRIVWSELHRMHSHLLWLGLFADAFGFESLFMQLWRLRERILDIDEVTTGNRIIVAVNIIGGVRRDLSDEQIAWIRGELDTLEKELKSLRRTILDDYTIKGRTKGVGILSKENAILYGAAGPVLRASGVAQDMRMTGYSGFDELDFEPVVEHNGDSYCRMAVRYREVLQSIDLVRQALSKLGGAGSELSAKVKPSDKPDGEAFVRVEQPRGELSYYIKGIGEKFLNRVHIRTPTFANIPPLLSMLKGATLSELPILVVAIDPCISCTER